MQYNREILYPTTVQSNYFTPLTKSTPLQIVRNNFKKRILVSPTSQLPDLLPVKHARSRLYLHIYPISLFHDRCQSMALRVCFGISFWFLGEGEEWDIIGERNWGWLVYPMLQGFPQMSNAVVYVPNMTTLCWDLLLLI